MSEADSGWFLRHRDGIEHGPFRLADIVAAAEAGNVADDTSVRHQVHTGGDWVLAGRVQPIAAVMPQRSQSPEQSPGGSPTTANKPAPSAAAPKSAFRRPRQQPPAVAPKAAGLSASVTPSTTAAEATAGTGSASSIRVREQAFPVPKRLVDAALALFDFRFRYFITPWIIKILWALAVAGALLWIAKMIYDYFIQPSMAAPGPTIAADGSPDWEFEPLAGESFFQTKFFLFTVRAGIISILLLCTRVAMESSIVFFRVASDVSELKRALKEERSE